MPISMQSSDTINMYMLQLVYLVQDQETKSSLCFSPASNTVTSPLYICVPKSPYSFCWLTIPSQHTYRPCKTLWFFLLLVSSCSLLSHLLTKKKLVYHIKMELALLNFLKFYSLSIVRVKTKTDIVLTTKYFALLEKLLGSQENTKQLYV